jgi:hypothetical protein
LNRFELERCDRFPIRHATPALQHHHRGHDPRWHRTTTRRGEQIAGTEVGLGLVMLLGLEAAPAVGRIGDGVQNVQSSNEHDLYVDEIWSGLK